MSSSKTQPATAPDPYEYAPVIKSRAGKAYADMVNSLAKRLLSRAEATGLGWPYYYDASPCRHGHVAARMTANTQCTDCWLISKGRPAIYPTAKDRKYYAEREPKAAAASAPSVVAAAAPLQPDGRDKKILEAIAECKTLAGAAASLKITVAQIEARRACDPVFAAALAALEDRLSIKRILPSPTDFAWSPATEQNLIRLWVDTGNIATARDSCGVTPSQYFAHIEESPEFKAMVDKAAPLASIAVRERMEQIALGNLCTGDLG